MGHNCAHNLIVVFLLTGCAADARTSTFESTLGNKARAVAEISGPEAEVLCNEGVDFVDATFMGVEGWTVAYCHIQGLNDGDDEASCLLAERECLDEFERTSFQYLYSYSERCGTLRRSGPPSDCTVAVTDIERCFREIADAYQELSVKPCAESEGMRDSLPISAGCYAIYAFDVDGPCRTVLGR